MLQENYHIEDDMESLAKLPAQLAESPAYKQASSRLIQVYTARVPLPVVRDFIEELRLALPEAVVIGVSATVAVELMNSTRDKPKEWLEEQARHWCVSVNCCYFRESQVSIRYLNVDALADAQEIEALEQELLQLPHLQGVEMFVANMDTRVDRVIAGLSEKLAQVPFFGMRTGFIHLSAEQAQLKDYLSNTTAPDWPSNEYLAVQGEFHPSGMVLVLFSGQKLHIEAQYLFGWHPIGKYLEAEEVEPGGFVGKIGGMPAADVYHKYLGVPLDKYFNVNIVEFPLVLQRKGTLLGRIPMSVDYVSKRICFPGEILEHEKLRFSYANQQELLTDTWKASEVLRLLQPEALIAFACGSRRLFLQEKADHEAESLLRFHPQTSFHHGMGEIYCLNGHGGVLAGALVLSAIWENWDLGACCSMQDLAVQTPELEPHLIPLNVRLAHFLRATSDDLAEYAGEARKQAAKAEAASQAKSSFLSNMSHEIRTPINTVIGLNEMILRESADEQIREYAEDVSAAAGHLLGLINDILDFSKIEAGKLEILPVEYATSSALNNTINMILVRARAKGLELKIEISPDLPSILKGDEVRIRQIAMNILTNAVKYTEQGSVTLRCKSRTLDKEHISLRFEIEDTGIGIKAEDMPKLFAAFERIEETRNRAVEGTGLGMNITQQLLKMMDSRLEVQSVYGKGSTFAFEVRQQVVDWRPLGDFEQQVRRATQLETGQALFIAPEAKVLVVDDVEMNIKVFKGLLKRTQIRVDSALSGEDCLKLVKKWKYDLVFLDHRMPNMDGIETLEHMQAMEHQCQGAPVIALTANALSGARTQYIEAGFTDYLTKPIDSAKLEEMLKKYLPPEKVQQAEEAASDEEPEAEALPEWLKKQALLNVASGIQNCGSAEDYLAALQVFGESYADNASAIKGFFEAGTWKDYTIKVHALKSSARIIGAGELSELAARLEQAGDAGDTELLRQETPRLLALYSECFGVIAPALADSADDDKPVLSEAELAEAYEAMREMAATFDYDSLMYVLEDLQDKQPAPEAREHYAAVCKAARKPDWNALQKLLS